MAAIAGLDVHAVTGWIDELGLGAEPPLAFSRLGRGKSNLTYLIRDAAGRRWVLRRPPLGELLASAHDVAREYRVLSALQHTRVPAPEALALSTDPTVCDVPLLLMEHVEAAAVDSIDAARALPEERRRALGRSMPEVLGRIHGVDLDATGLTGLASHKPYAERQLKRWRGQWEQSRTRDLPLVDELADRLAAHVPEQREVVLVHGDFHLLNVLVERERGVVRAVLDWELCTLGDPLADLGGLLAYWPQADDDPIAGSAPLSTLPGFPPRDELAAIYAETTGRDLTALPFWHALACWKVAVIIEGVRRRALDTPENAGTAGVLDAQIVDNLVERARQVADAAGI